MTAPIRLDADGMTQLRREVFFRDGYRCARCNRRVTWNTGHLAHIIARSKGGSDTLGNTECSCEDCHIGDEHNPRAVAKL